jgi:hypothetical protein
VLYDVYYYYVDSEELQERYNIVQEKAKEFFDFYSVTCQYEQANKLKTELDFLKSGYFYFWVLFFFRI